MIKLGPTIKKLRARRGLSQRQLAAEAGVSYSFLSLVESSARNPGENALAKIALALDVPIEVLFWDSLAIPNGLSELDKLQCSIAKRLVEKFYGMEDENENINVK